jgi:hypothetical protein
MEEAIENRGANYGVFMEKYVEDLPESVGWFNEYNGKYLVVALSSREDQTFYNNLADVAYRWARIRALTSIGDASNPVKTPDITGELEKISNSISHFKTIRTYCTNASEAVEKIKNELRTIELEIKGSLDEISTVIKG